jgi:hypothetical protein
MCAGPFTSCCACLGESTGHSNWNTSHLCVCLQAAGHVLLQRWLSQPGPLRAWLVNQPTLVNTCMGVLLGEAPPPPTPPPAAAAAAAAGKGKAPVASPVVVDPQVRARCQGVWLAVS